MHIIQPKLFLEIVLGVTIGAVVANPSLRAILHFNLFYLFFFASAGLYFLYVCLRYKNVTRVLLPLSEYILYILFMFILVYGLISTTIEGLGKYVHLLDLCGAALLFLIGRSLTTSMFRSFLITIILVGIIHSALLIFYRGYVYSSGVNYLLMSLMVGLSICLLIILCLRENTTLGKALFGFLFVFCFVGLFQMQSRATVLVCTLFLMISPFVCLKRSSYVKVIILSLCLIAIIFAYYYQMILDIYEASVIFVRMDALVNNFSNEPRLNTYNLFFNNIDEFFITGYGMGGTTNGIYLNSLEKYPHNFILEFYSEFGLLGLAFSVYLICLCLYNLNITAHKNTSYIIVATSFFYYFMTFMKSFTIYDSSVFFFMMGLTLSDITKRDWFIDEFRCFQHNCDYPNKK